jgi:hypothetical protein
MCSIGTFLFTCFGTVLAYKDEIVFVLLWSTFSDFEDICIFAKVIGVVCLFAQAIRFF